MARSKRTKLDEDGEDTSLMSLLDTLSNGLGAAVLLGLIFSLTRAEEPVSLSAPEAILVEIRWNDPSALMNLRVKPPWECAPYELDLTEQRMRSGAVVEQKCGPHTMRFVSYGLSQRGTDALTTTDTNERSAMILVLGPPDATWQFDDAWQLGVRYFNRLEPIDKWSKPLKQRVTVTASVTVGDASKEKRPTTPKVKDLAVGELMALDAIRVVAR